MTTIKYPIAIIFTFIWIGFICAISFMEAWLKFRAPGITLPLGLGIGRIVFNALNKMEWIFAVIISANILLSKGNLQKIQKLLLLISVIFLLIQTFVFLPTLDVRAELYIQELTIPPSNLHFYYVAIEIAKVTCLNIFGISLFKNNTI